MDENLEKLPSARLEDGNRRQVPNEEDFEKSFEEGVPPFAGDKQGETENSELYGESSGDNMATSENHEYEQGISEAAKIINNGYLNELAKRNGIESVVSAIKNIDLAGCEDPMGAIYDHFGVDSTYEYKQLQDEAEATRATEEKFKDDYGVGDKQNSKEGIYVSFEFMKRLIKKVEGADSIYSRLRVEASSNNMGYFEYALRKYNKEGLTGLFEALSLEKEDIERNGILGVEGASEKVTKEEEGGDKGASGLDSESTQTLDGRRRDEVLKDGDFVELSSESEKRIGDGIPAENSAKIIDFATGATKLRGETGEGVEKEEAA